MDRQTCTQVSHRATTPTNQRQRKCKAFFVCCWLSKQKQVTLSDKAKKTTRRSTKCNQHAVEREKARSHIKEATAIVTATTATLASPARARWEASERFGVTEGDDPAPESLQSSVFDPFLALPTSLEASDPDPLDAISMLSILTFTGAGWMAFGFGVGVAVCGTLLGSSGAGV